MKTLVPILLALAFGAAAWAQVTPQDYQAWRAAERAPYAILTDATAPLTLDASYHLWRAAEQASYRDLDSLAYHAWRHAEQRLYSTIRVRSWHPAMVVTRP